LTFTWNFMWKSWRCIDFHILIYMKVMWKVFCTWRCIDLHILIYMKVMLKVFCTWKCIDFHILIYVKVIWKIFAFYYACEITWGAVWCVNSCLVSFWLVYNWMFIDAPPSFLMDSNVNPNWKQRKNKESRHAPSLTALWGVKGCAGVPGWD
jgi:hypothetical protein